jgi:hypothetical protein
MYDAICLSFEPNVCVYDISSDIDKEIYSREFSVGGMIL